VITAISTSPLTSATYRRPLYAKLHLLAQAVSDITWQASMRQCVFRSAQVAQYGAPRPAHVAAIRIVCTAASRFRAGDSRSSSMCVIDARRLQARRSGSRRKRCPEAANTALATAGATTGTPGSPTPPGDAVLGTMCTSTCGISASVSSG